MIDSLEGTGQADMKQKEKQLLNHFRKLSSEDARSLLSFAEFLAVRSLSAGPEESLQLNKIERPAEESVIAAIKRLSVSYPMLDKDRMLTETSALVAQHIMKGREANEVIDDLEQVFERHYATHHTTQSEEY